MVKFNNIDELIEFLCQKVKELHLQIYRQESIKDLLWCYRQESIKNLFQTDKQCAIQDSDLLQCYVKLQNAILEKHSCLLKCIVYCDEAYYVYNTSVVSDQQYDKYWDDLRFLETQLPDNLRQQTTRSVGSSLGKLKLTVVNQPVLTKVPHSAPMLSITSSDKVDDLTRFFKRLHQRLYKNQPTSQIAITTECKIDGLSMAIRYEKGKFAKALTRGDGVRGEDVTMHASYINDIPKRLSSPLTIEIRGEVYLPSDYRLNDEISRRNIAAGMINCKIPQANIQDMRALRFIPYGIVNARNYDLETQMDVIEFLKKLSFRSMTHYQKCIVAIKKRHQNDSEEAINQEEVAGFFAKLHDIRSKLPFEADGVVCKVNDLALQQELGEDHYSPNWSFAYKFPLDISAVTVIKNVDWQVSRRGKVTPVAVLAPVPIGGVVVKKASLHNYDYIKNLAVKINDQVEIKRMGDVIPQVTKVIASSDASVDIRVPEKCPVCHHVISNEICTGDTACAAQVEEKIEHFVNIVGIDGLGIAKIKFLVCENFIKSPSDIFRLHKITNRGQKLLVYPDWGVLSIRNLLSNIEDKRSMTLDTCIASLDIERIGSRVAQKIASYFNYDLKQFLDSLPSLDSAQDPCHIGEVAWKSFVNFCHTNVSYIKDLVSEIRIVPVTTKPASTNDSLVHDQLKDQNVVFTGKFKDLSRKQVQQYAAQLGASLVQNNITSKTNILICGDNPNQNKLTKAQDAGLKILNSQEWHKILQDSSLY